MAHMNPFQAALRLVECHSASEPLSPSAPETEIGRIEAKPAGIIAALMNLIGLGKTTTLTYTNRRLIREDTAPAAVDRVVIPMSKVAFASYGFSKPLAVLIMGFFLSLSGLISAFSSRDLKAMGWGILVLGVILIVYYFLAKRSYYIWVVSDGVVGTSIKLKVPDTGAMDGYCGTLVDQVRLNTSVGSDES